MLLPLLLFSFVSERSLRAEEPPPSIETKQGEVVYLTVKLDSGADAVTGDFLNHPISFFKTPTGDFAALVGIDLAQPPGAQPLTVRWKEGEKTRDRKYVIKVKSADFGTQSLTLPKKMVDLDPPTLARVEMEQQKMMAVFDTGLNRKLWNGNFLVPAEGKIDGAFGRRRVMNGQPRNPHTGEDIHAQLGSPVLASNGGKVIMVGDYYFNGHSVIIDHGFGLFSMYFHLLDVAVKEGETVTRGERIGSVGQSGRATGPHLHWGMRLNGARINPFSLVEKKLD